MEELVNELEVIVIPPGVELHLFDVVKKEIVRPHFISTGPLNVLVRRDHGPLYNLLKSYFTSTDFLSSLKSMMYDLKSLYQTGGDTEINKIIDILYEQVGMIQDVDALYMASTTDGKVGLTFIHRGEKPDLTQLR